MIDLTSHEAIAKCLIKDPIVLSPRTKLVDAALTMAQVNQMCSLENTTESEMISSKSSCVLVMEQERLLGIVTERDLLKLLTLGITWQNLTLGEVMSSPAVTVQWDEDLTPLSISNILQKQKIRHLPVLDHKENLVGVITHQLLRNVIEAAHLLRLRFVQEVMVETVVYGAVDDSLWDIADLMLTHNIGSVVVADPHPELDEALVPVGLVTEQDILQLQALGVNLRDTAADKAMISPVKTIKATDSLIQAKHLMEQARTHRLVVVGEDQELVGLLTQSNVIEAINQHEMFKLVHFLEQQVQERTADLDRLNHKLQQEVQERRKAERRIRLLSLMDELTGLYNRRGFFLLVEQELKLTEHRELPFSLFFMDIDNLKVINDNFGHEMGDQMIIDMTQHLNGCFRKADILARLGGDEFTCFALLSKGEAKLLVKRLDVAIAAFNRLQKRPYELSISVGYVSYDDYQDLSLRQLIKQADEKMYEQKVNKKKQRQHSSSIQSAIN